MGITGLGTKAFRLTPQLSRPDLPKQHALSFHWVIQHQFGYLSRPPSHPKSVREY